MRKIDEVLSIPDIGDRIEELKKHRGRYKAPDTAANLAAWDPMKHDIMDKEKHKDERVMVEKGRRVYDEASGSTVVTDDRYEDVEVNRIPLPIEQDIVNIHTAFAVGTEPDTVCDTDDRDEKRLLSALRQTFRKNYVKYLNRQEVRSLLSEQEVAEYWYAAPDTDGFWAKTWRRISAAVTGKFPAKRPRCVVWSPFRGDELVPFMEDGQMTAFMRGYTVAAGDGDEERRYMCITDRKVFTWRQEKNGGWVEDPGNTYEHGFSKIPVVYMWRSEPLTKNISHLRARLEKTLSQYGDCIDYHFFPYLVHFGEAENVQGGKRNHIIQVTGRDAKAPIYLTWDQVPDTVKFEVETNLELAYSLTNTPRISFDRIKSMAAVSGTAYRFHFMGAHMATENHYEEVGPFLQRRVNLVSTILGEMNSSLLPASQTADIEAVPQPYMIDCVADRVKTAVEASGGPVWSTKAGIAFVGNAVQAEDEYERILEERKEKEDGKEPDAKTVTD